MQLTLQLDGDGAQNRADLIAFLGSLHGGTATAATVPVDNAAEVNDLLAELKEAQFRLREIARVASFDGEVSSYDLVAWVKALAEGNKRDFAKFERIAAAVGFKHDADSIDIDTLIEHLRGLADKREADKLRAELEQLRTEKTKRTRKPKEAGVPEPAAGPEPADEQPQSEPAAPADEWPADVTREEFAAWKADQQALGITENLNPQAYRQLKAAGLIVIRPDSDLVTAENYEAWEASLPVYGEEEQPVAVAEATVPKQPAPKPMAGGTVTASSAEVAPDGKWANDLQPGEVRPAPQYKVPNPSAPPAVRALTQALNEFNVLCPARIEAGVRVAVLREGGSIEAATITKGLPGGRVEVRTDRGLYENVPEAKLKALEGSSWDQPKPASEPYIPF